MISTQSIIESYQQENSNLKRDLANAFMESESRRKRIVELAAESGRMCADIDVRDEKIATLRTRVVELGGELVKIKVWSHRVVATVAIRKNGLFLIIKRSQSLKVFPGLWTIPGGGLDGSDYENKPCEFQSNQWYNILSDVARREVREEVGLTVGPLHLVTDLVFKRPDGVPVVAVTFWADWVAGEVVLNDESSEHLWIEARHADKHSLIPGITHELEIAQTLSSEHDTINELESRCEKALNLLCVSENLLVRTETEGRSDDWLIERKSALVRIDEFIELETSKKKPCCPCPSGDLKALANAIDYTQCYTNNETMTAPRKIADLQQAAEALRCMADKDDRHKELREVLVVACRLLSDTPWLQENLPLKDFARWIADRNAFIQARAQDTAAHIDKVLGGVQ